MHPALSLLLRRRRHAFWRRALAGLKTPRGAIVFVFTIGFLAFMLLPQFVLPLIAMFSPEGAKTHRHMVETTVPVIRTLGPLGLLALVLWSVATSWGDSAIYFSPADVDFLFPGPFSRRDLLLYKLSQSIRGNIAAGTFFSIFTAPRAPLLAGAWFGTVLTVLFINAITLTLTLVGQVVSQQAYSRVRRILLAAFLVIVGLGIGAALRGVGGGDLLTAAERFRQSRAGSIVLAPFEVFPRIIIARELSEVALWASVGVAMIAGLYGLSISLDANYLEAAQQVSERVYARLQRRRQSGGGGALANMPLGVSRRIRIPRLPWLGGLGPNIWRQWLLLVRRSQGLLTLVAIVVAMGAVLFMVAKQSGSHSQVLLPAVVIGGLAYQSLLASIQLPTGFRGDIDRIDWLKSLPLHPAAIVGGQVSGGALLLSATQAILLIAVWIARGGDAQIYAAGLALIVPVNLLCFGVDNLVFLFFPVRATASSAGDFQFMGKYMLLAMFKVVLLAVALAIAAAGAIVYLIIPQLWLAVSCSLLLLSAIDALVLLLATQAFLKFDVSLDTPPM